MPRHLLKLFTLSGLPLGKAGRLRRWLPVLHTPGGSDSIFVSKPADWLPDELERYQVNISEIEDSLLPDGLDSEKLRQKLNEHKGYLRCGENPPVDSSSERRSCPAECPVMGENRRSGPHCDFHCVEATAEACTDLDGEATVVDREHGLCRPCAVAGCRECVHDGTDTCLKCSTGFYLGTDGRCVNRLWYCWWLFFGALLAVVGLVVLWVVDLWMRPITNQTRLDHALDLRSRAKLRQPKDPGTCEGSENVQRETRALWPLFATNLCSNGTVAGPGLALAFNFQVCIIFWAVVMGLGWIFLGLSVDTDLFIMGTRRWDSPRQQCLVTAWGYEAQHRLMWAKVAYLAFAYVFTFLGSMLFSIRQLRMYQTMDLNTSTHKDFCAVASGLHGISGEELLEEELKEFFEKETGKRVIAVSVSWEYFDYKDEIMGIIDNDMFMLHNQDQHERSWLKGTPLHRVDEEPAEQQQRQLSKQSSVQSIVDGVSGSAAPYSHVGKDGGEHSLWRKVMMFTESAFLSDTVQRALTRGRARGFAMRHKLHAYVDEAAPDRAGEEHNKRVMKILHGLKASGKVFVVFNTEKERDSAVATAKAKSNGQGMTFKGKPVKLDVAEVEPEGVTWSKFADESVPFGHKRKVASAVVSIAFALCIWAGVFYLPFVWVSASASYTYGQSPSQVSQTVFGFVVVLGNVMMYTACSEVADRMRFPYQKDTEVCYMIFYTISCVFNVVLDLVVTCFMAYWQLSGSGARMYDGQPISEAPTLVSLLMTYGMQREMGENAQAYAWPSTFLIPFLIEPVAAIYVPYQLMVLLVRGHSDISTAASEAYLASIPFDLSRYADIHLNVILAVLILFFPGGHNLIIFFGLAISHVWIYVYDHARVLRAAPRFQFASMDVDWWAQWMLAFPCGILLSVFMWKCNQDMEFKITKMALGGLGDPRQSSIGVVAMVAAAFAGHVLLHTWLLKNVVPLFGISEDSEGDSADTYQDCAERLPCSWLTSNPVLCLRSDYIYQHRPPITFCQLGKEHLLVKNEEVGQYFEDSKSKAEEAWSPNNLQQIGQMLASVVASPSGNRPSRLLSWDDDDERGGDVVGRGGRIDHLATRGSEAEGLPITRG
jgi:hypothetical protein